MAPLALHPESGGPKNLPIAKVYLSDIEDPENTELSQKPHLVIVGGGWGVRNSPWRHAHIVAAGIDEVYAVSMCRPSAC